MGNRSGGGGWRGVGGGGRKLEKLENQVQFPSNTIVRTIRIIRNGI